VFYVGRGENTARKELQYCRGLFQGDSHPPFLFCFSIAPISLVLRKTAGFSVLYLASPVTHLFFMDDLKVYAKGAKALRHTLELLDRGLRAVGMELGLRKCVVIHIKHKKYVSEEDYLLPDDQKIKRCLRKVRNYQYLGI